MHLVRAPNGVRSRFRNPEMPDLPLCLQANHRTDRILDRHGFIHPMDEVEIDIVGPETLEALVAGLDHVFRIALGPRLAIRKTNVPELGREDIFAAALERATDELLVCAIRPISVRRVDE